MACFIVPAAEAVVTTVVTKTIDKKTENKEPSRIRQKVKWLTNMLWGGSAILALEHAWHGEISIYPPFLTAMSNPQDTTEMLHEMATTGVGMALLVTAVWAGMVGVTEYLEKKSEMNTEEV